MKRSPVWRASYTDKIVFPPSPIYVEKSLLALANMWLRQLGHTGFTYPAPTRGTTEKLELKDRTADGALLQGWAGKDVAGLV